MIVPGAMIGVLGGGQLGDMFAVAARRLGYAVAVWDPDPAAPGLRGADLPIVADFRDEQACRRFAASVRAVTYEWENVPAETCRRLEQTLPVRPSAQVLHVLQNRLSQKRFFAERGIAVTPFRTATSIEELARAGEVGFPCLCKTATTGYDGKGQWKLAREEDVGRLQAELAERGVSRTDYILEQWVAFEREISVLVVRSSRGDLGLYPVVENVHEGGILRTTRVPAQLSAAQSAKAQAVARAAVEALDGIGVFCVEMFVLSDGDLYVNEVAPRPHNSGHYTLDACTVSQFEQQVRALCELPLGEVRLLAPAAMINLIGEDLPRIQAEPEIGRLLAVPGAKLHLYGKRSVRPRRKMGHVTFVGEKPETVWEAACALRSRLQPVASPEAQHGQGG